LQKIAILSLVSTSNNRLTTQVATVWMGGGVLSGVRVSVENPWKTLSESVGGRGALENPKVPNPELEPAHWHATVR
jgi:hypothetical protein